jgi:hypothetical protein
VEHFFLNREYGVGAYTDICWISLDLGGLDSVVGIATRNWLDGPGFESRRGRDFQGPSKPTPRPTDPPNDPFPLCKRPWHGAEHAPRSSAGVK